MSSSRGGRGAALLIALRKRQDEERKKLQELEAAVSTTQGSESTTTVTEEDSTVEAARQSLETSSMHHDPPPPPSSSETATSSSTTITLPSTSMDSASSKSAESVTKAPFKLKEPLKYHGSAGREIKLACNYLVMEVEKDKGIFEYGVSFSPGVDSAPERFKLLNQHRETFGLSKVFDGSRLLLPFKMKEDKTTLVASKITGEAEGQSGEEVEIQVSFRRKKELEDPECLQLFNSIFKRLFKKLNLAQMKSGLNLRSYFDPSNRQVLAKHRLEIWPGYVVNVDAFEGGLLVQCDCASKIMRTETVLDVLTACFQKDKANYRDSAIKNLVGGNLITRYNNRTYRIDDINFNASPEDSFVNSRGESMTFIEYYKNNYGLEIRDSKQPMITSLIKKFGEDKDAEPIKVCLIPELCFLTGLTDSQRADFRVMKDVAVHTRHAPNERQNIMLKLFKSIRENPEALQVLSSWGLKLSEKNLRVDGRLLNPTTLIFGGGFKEVVGPKGDWGRTTTSKPALSTFPLSTWSLIFPGKEGKTAKSFNDILASQAPKMGIKVSAPNTVALPNDRLETYLKAIREQAEETQIVVIIFSGAVRADRYAAIKKLCYVEKALPCQVVMQKTLTNEKRLQAVVQKVALQINCKLGGELWGLNIPIPKLCVIGIDVYRDKSAGGSSSRNVAAIVGSISSSYGKYFSTVVFEKAGTKFTDELISGIVKTLQKFAEHNEESFPERVILFRDGVTGGQLHQLQREAEDIKAGIENFYDNDLKVKCPSVAVVAVQKKVNTKIYDVTRPSKADNPPAGTILDHTVALREYYDYFLVPMNVNQGTVTPTHFVILTESPDSALKPDIMQRISYALTHMYFNWPGNVKVPAPCQYAHKLVEMVGEHLHKETNPMLSDKLFYL